MSFFAPDSIRGAVVAPKSGYSPIHDVFSLGNISMSSCFPKKYTTALRMHVKVSGEQGQDMAISIFLEI